MNRRRALAQNSLWTRTMRYMNYRPGYWALYMLYCSIPIGVYVAYLLRRSKESDKEEREALTVICFL